LSWTDKNSLKKEILKIYFVSFVLFVLTGTDGVASEYELKQRDQQIERLREALVKYVLILTTLRGMEFLMLLSYS
jgi:hypothetical protein